MKLFIKVIKNVERGDLKAYKKVDSIFENCTLEEHYELLKIAVLLF